MWEWLRRKLGIMKHINDATSEEINDILEGFSMREDLNVRKGYKGFDFIAEDGIAVHLEELDQRDLFLVTIVDNEMCLKVSSAQGVNIHPRMHQKYGEAVHRHKEDIRKKLEDAEKLREQARRQLIKKRRAILQRIRDKAGVKRVM